MNRSIVGVDVFDHLIMDLFTKQPLINILYRVLNAETENSINNDRACWCSIAIHDHGYFDINLSHSVLVDRREFKYIVILRSIFFMFYELIGLTQFLKQQHKKCCRDK